MARRLPTPPTRAVSAVQLRRASQLRHDASLSGVCAVHGTRQALQRLLASLAPRIRRTLLGASLPHRATRTSAATYGGGHGKQRSNTASVARVGGAQIGCSSPRRQRNTPSMAVWCAPKPSQFTCQRLGSPYEGASYGMIDAIPRWPRPSDGRPAPAARALKKTCTKSIEESGGIS